MLAVRYSNPLREKAWRTKGKEEKRNISRQRKVSVHPVFSITCCILTERMPAHTHTLSSFQQL